MAHITLPENMPGIRGPMIAYPETAEHLRALTDALMCGISSLTHAEREIIGTYVSSRNECVFCTRSHASVVKHLLGKNGHETAEMLSDLCRGEISELLDEKMHALLVIAEKVRLGGREVSAADITAAREAGADDKAIHDTVLITALFGLFNRYVEGLATWVPDDPQIYEESGALRAAHGYGSITGKKA